MIISVGYRVKSKNGIIFRKWDNKVLKEYKKILSFFVKNKEMKEFYEILIIEGYFI